MKLTLPELSDRVKDRIHREFPKPEEPKFNVLKYNLRNIQAFENWYYENRFVMDSMGYNREKCEEYWVNCRHSDSDRWKK